jgi:hypothetical protein
MVLILFIPDPMKPFLIQPDKVRKLAHPGFYHLINRLFGFTK